MTDLEIIKHLNSISDLQAAIANATELSYISLDLHRDMAEQSRYSLILRESTNSGVLGWGPTPAEALANLRLQESKAAEQDRITAQVEAYRKQLEQEQLGHD